MTVPEMPTEVSTPASATPIPEETSMPVEPVPQAPSVSSTPKVDLSHTVPPPPPVAAPKVDLSASVPAPPPVAAGVTPTLKSEKERKKSDDLSGVCDNIDTTSFEKMEEPAAPASRNFDVSQLQMAMSNLRKPASHSSSGSTSSIMKESSAPKQDMSAPKIVIPGKKLFVRNTPKDMSFKNLIKLSSKVPLKKTECPRSPGGTPLRKATRKPTNFLEAALKRKFKVRLNVFFFLRVCVSFLRFNDLPMPLSQSLLCFCFKNYLFFFPFRSPL